jgi:hypothetical protein
MENALVGPPAELRMTIQVIRYATGQVETYELVGKTQPETPDVSNPQRNSESGGN